MSESRIGSTSWNGSAVHVEDVGAGAGVVLLHSSGMSGDQWRRTAEGLRQGGARTIVPDFLGSGRSAPWPEGKPFQFQNDVDVTVGLLRQVGEPVHLVGHSYGGFIALQAALREPARVLSMALYDPVAFGVLDPEADADALEDRSRLAFDWGETPAEHEAWPESALSTTGAGHGTRGPGCAVGASAPRCSASGGSCTRGRARWSTTARRPRRTDRSRCRPR